MWPRRPLSWPRSSRSPRSPARPRPRTRGRPGPGLSARQSERAEAGCEPSAPGHFVELLRRPPAALCSGRPGRALVPSPTSGSPPTLPKLRLRTGGRRPRVRARPLRPGPCTGARPGPPPPILTPDPHPWPPRPPSLASRSPPPGSRPRPREKHVPAAPRSLELQAGTGPPARAPGSPGPSHHRRPHPDRPTEESSRSTQASPAD